jgi:ABC-type antimicrobial peptide transport system permease subunit
MKFWALRKLLRLSLKRDVSLACSSVFGISLAVGSLLFFLGVGLGLTAFIQHLFPVEAKRFEVKAPKWAVGETEFKKLDEATCAEFQKLEHVRALYRKMEVRAPGVTRVNDKIFNIRINMGLEVVAVGVEPALFEAEVPRELFVEDKEAVPVVLNSHLLDVYNQHFAPKNGLPLLKGDMLQGFGFDVFFNQSFFAGNTGEVLSQEFFVAGFSPRAFLAGISIPLESAKRINQALGKDAEHYSSVVIEVDDSAHLPKVIQQLERMGFKADTGERQWAEQLGLAIWAVTGGLSLLSILIGVLVTLNIAQGLSHSLRMRESEFAIFRAVGATPAQLVSLMVVEALVLALLGGVLGVAAAWGGGYLLNMFLFSALGNFPLLPHHFFALSLEGCLGGLLGAMLAALLGVWGPSRRLRKMAPAAVLAGR